MVTLTERYTTVEAKIKDLLDHLCKGLYEREEAIRLSLLTAIAGESIFLLGPPGVGKSLIARRLKFAFSEGKSFEYLMSKFSTPDEIFGPISIKKLKEEDKYERLVENYLPGANIVFLDEIWKAGPAIQNALLTILNEKVYKNGENELSVDIRGIITASNELPVNNSNLAPIWDRFLVRLEMGNIKKISNFINMITDTSDVYVDHIPKELKLTNSDLNELTNRINKVKIGPEVLNTIQMIKIKLEQHNARSADNDRSITIHDRRWKKAINLMRTSALLNGRTSVDLMDCFLMKHCLWNKPTHKQIIIDLIAESIEKHGYSLTVNLNVVKKEIEELNTEVDDEILIKRKISREELLPIKDKYFRLKDLDGQFKGSLIEINQYRSLSLDTQKVINFFDEEENLINRINTAKGKQEHTIEVFRNANIHIYQLETKLQEENEIIHKTAHPVMIDHWNKKYDQLKEYLQGQIKHMEQHHPQELDQLTSNLFVEEVYVDIVKKNYTTTLNELNRLLLNLEKIHYKYAH